MLGLFSLLLVTAPAWADTGVISATGTGRDSPDAIANLLRTTVGRYFKEEPAQLTRAVLQTEILPNASSFVQSYKITEGGKGTVNLSANVDLDVIHGLLSLTPKNLGEAEGARSLVMVRGAKLPDSLLSTLKGGAPAHDPFATLAETARERFQRREFAEAQLSATELQAVGAGEDIASPELLRGLGAKAGARVALGITARFETYDNENSHNKEERLVLSATMVDVKAGVVMGRASVHVPNPKSRKEQYIADLQRNILEESKDLFHDVFVASGRRLGRTESHSEFSVVRVQYPSNAVLVARFKALLEGVPGVRSVVEYSVRRGRFDFAVRPAMPEAALTKAVAALQAPDLAVALADGPGAAEPEAHPPAVVVKLAPKEAAPGAPNEGVAPNANH